MTRAKFTNDDVVVSAYDIHKMALSGRPEAEARIKGVTGEVSEFTLFRTDPTDGHEYEDHRHVQMDMEFDANKEVYLRGDGECQWPVLLIVHNLSLLTGGPRRSLLLPARRKRS